MNKYVPTHISRLFDIFRSHALKRDCVLNIDWDNSTKTAKIEIHEADTSPALPLPIPKEHIGKFELCLKEADLYGSYDSFVSAFRVIHEAYKIRKGTNIMNTIEAETKSRKQYYQQELSNRIRDYVACNGHIAIFKFDIPFDGDVQIQIYKSICRIGTIYIAWRENNTDEEFDEFVCLFEELLKKHSSKPDGYGFRAAYMNTDEPKTLEWKKYNPFIRRNSVPDIKNVIFNNPAVVVIWADDTKTVVKAQPGEEYDPEKGLAMAISKKALGNQGNYYDTFTKWLPGRWRQIDICEAVKEVEAYEVVEPARKEGSE